MQSLEMIFKIQHWVNQMQILTQSSVYSKSDIAIFQQSFRVG